MNVKKGLIFKIIQEHLNDLTEYDIHYEVLNTQDCGVPQSRARLYMIGIKKGLNKTFKMLRPHIPLPSIITYLDTSHTGSRATLLKRHNQHIDEALSRVNGSEDENWIITVDCNGSFVNCKKDITPCITYHSRHFYISSLRRCLPIPELLTLQGFPADYPLPVKGNRHRYIGNAMSVNVLYYILASLFCN